MKITEEEKKNILSMYEIRGNKNNLNEQEISGGNFVISDVVTTTSENDIFIINILDKTDEKRYSVFLKRLYSGKKRVKDILGGDRHIEDMEKYSEIEKYVLSKLENIDLPKRFSFNIINGKTKPLF